MTTTTHKALQLDGSSGFATLASAEFLGLVDCDFTVEAWVRVSGWGDTDYLPIVGTAATEGQQGLHLAIKEQKPYMGFYQNDTSGSTVLATDTWYHLAWRFAAASGEQTLFVNGVQDGTSTGNGAFQGTEDLFVGRYAAQNFFDGEIADLRIWRRALSAADVLEGMHRRLEGDEPGLAGYWPLDDGAGASAANRKAGQDGQSRDAVAASLPSPLPPRLDRVLTFERDYLRVWMEVPTTESTHEFWFKTSDPNAGLLSCGRVDDTNTDRDIYLHGGNIRFYVWGGATYTTTGLDLADGQWHHVAHVFGSSVSGQRLYVDGIECKTGTRTSSSFGRMQWIAVGQSNRASNKIFSGQIAEVRIWDKALTQAEIRARRFQAVGAGEPGLIACLPLDEGANDRVRSIDRLSRYQGVVSGDITRVVDEDCPFDDHQALAFGGTDSLIEVSGFQGVGRKHPPGSAEEGFTAEVWIRCDTPDMDMMIFNYRVNSTDYDLRLRLYNQGKNLQVHLRNSYKNFATEEQFNDDTWMHLALTWRRSDGRWTFYKNGTPVFDPTTWYANGDIRRGGALSIGRYYSNGYPNSYRYTGRMTELRLWDTVRSAEEIAATAGHRLSGHEPYLVGYWPLNDLGETGDAAENRARPYVDYYGAPFWQKTPAEVAPPPIARRRVLGLEAPTTLAVPEDEALRLDQYTIELWVDAQELPSAAATLVEQRGDDLAVAMLLLNSDGSLTHRFVDQGSTLAGPTDTGAGMVEARRWTHLAITHDGATVRTLVDGVTRSVAPALACKPFVFGFRFGEGFAGRLAEVRVWNVARDEDTIAAERHWRLRGDEDGLAGYWPLDEPPATGPLAGRVLDHAACRGRLPAHAEAADGWRPAPQWPFDDGSAVELDGQGAALEIPHRPDFQFARADEDFTLEIWVRAEREPAGGEESTRVVAEKWGGGGGFPFAVRYLPASGRFELSRSDGTTPHPTVLSTDTFRDGAFHHVAAIKRGAELELYVDAEPQGTATDTVTGTIRGTSALHVGSRAGGSHNLTGAVTELRLWRVARTQQELFLGTAERLQGHEAHLVGYWPLDRAGAAEAEGDEAAVGDGDGGEARDGRARPPGVLQDTAGWSAAPGLPLLGEVSDEAEGIAPAAAFDGQRSVITMASAAGLTPSEALTVEAWVCPEATGGAAFEGPVVSLCDAVNGWELRATDQEYGFLLTVDGVRRQVSWKPPGGAAGRWVHLVGVYDGSRLALRIHGIAVPAAGLDVTGPITPATGALSIGRSAYRPGRCFRGRIAEVRLWSTARSAAEIHGALFRRLVGDETDLQAYWPLSEGQGDAFGDLGPTALNGTGENVRWVAAELPPRLPAGEVAEADLAYLVRQLEERIAENSEELDRAVRRRKYREGRKSLRESELDAAEQARLTEESQLDATWESRILSRQREVDAILAARRQEDLQEVDALLDDIVKKTHEQIARARGDLDRRDGIYRLGRVSVDLRYVAGAGGRGAVFPEVDAPVEGDRVTSLSLDFAPDTGTEPPPEEPRYLVPDVVGYTDTLAQRKLVDAGFLAESHAQAVPGEPGWVGRVVSQLPAAGSESVPNATVRMFVGKES